MTRLQDQLERLAERGPIAEPRFVVRAALQRASIDSPSSSFDGPAERSAWSEGSTPSTRLRLQEQVTAGGPRWQHRRRMVGVAAAAMIAVAGLGAVALSRSAIEHPAANMSPADIRAFEETTTTVTPTTVGVSARPDDPMWKAWMFSLLNVPTWDELVTFLSYNIPQSEVAACMHNAGFQYTEVLSEAEQIASDPKYTLSPADFAANYGMGITASELGLMPPSIVDPNLDYVESLSAEEQERYFRWQGSCAGATAERMKHSTAVNVAFDEFLARLRGDDRIIAAEAGWRDCMATAGYVYAGRQTMLESFYARMGAGITHDELQQLFGEEVAVATAGVPCEAAYKAAYRDVASSRYGEFRDLLDTAFAAPDS